MLNSVTTRKSLRPTHLFGERFDLMFLPVLLPYTGRTSFPDVGGFLMTGRTLRFVVAGLALSFVVSAVAQFGSHRVTMLANIAPALFGSSGGNDCWGYVSPSGREYALMGLRNQVAFVEITDPKHPVWVASIPHLTSTWGAIKVYGHYAYVATEATGSGLQVIDMRQIDQQVVTLVKTIASPGRTHTLAVDELSGFLYTCGSRNGTGWTMCFSLADPANPVQVGAASMSERYLHEAQVVTYPSGPYQGRQILFGFSEDRGVDIIDVTNKAAPFLIKRVIYPNMRYSHQGWLSADRKYLYVDDELDEGATGNPTRSLIFNVESLENATYIGTFSSGLLATDHNQYVDDGFLFQANYKSGLRIFDTYGRPTNPLAVGHFDTYPESNANGYEGAWSNFPFFPSGTVIVSDINRGLFILDVTEATTREIMPGKVFAGPDTSLNGDAKYLELSDDRYVTLQRANSTGRSPAPLEGHFRFYSATPEPLKLKLELEVSAAQTPMIQTVEWFDPATQAYVLGDSQVVGGTDLPLSLEAPGVPKRFVAPGTHEVHVRVRYASQNSRYFQNYSVAIDRAVVKAVR